MLLRFFTVMANIKEYRADESGQYADKQRPFCGHFAAAVNCHGVRVNRVSCRPVVNYKADSYCHANQKDKYAKFFHCKILTAPMLLNRGKGMKFCKF